MNPECLPSRSAVPASAGSFGSKRYVVLHSLPHLADLSDQVRRVFCMFDEIDFRAVHHEQWGLIIMEEILSIGLRYAFDVLRSNVLFVILRTLLTPLSR